jgi:hypothetical protein
MRNPPARPPPPGNRDDHIFAGPAVALEVDPDEGPAASDTVGPRLTGNRPLSAEHHNIPPSASTWNPGETMAAILAPPCRLFLRAYCS